MAWNLTRKDGATGVDGVTAADCERDLEANLSDLLVCSKNQKRIRRWLAQFDSDTARIAAASRRMEAALAPCEALVRLLETLPGAGRESAMAILVELGPDMSVFASARRCAAWTGICPGNNESAGKRRSGRIRRGNPILRAIVAVAHKMLRTIYAMLRDGTPYADPGIDYEAISIGRKASRWLQKLEQYGYVNVRAREEQTDMSARPA